MRNSFIILLLLTCLEALPQIEFQRTYGGMNKENSYQIIETPDKSAFSLGSTESFGSGKSDIYLIKIDSIGNLIWGKAYGGVHNDFGHFVDKTKDGNLIILGHSLSYSQEYPDICLIKVNYNGEVLWSKSYGLDKSDYSTVVKATSDGGYIILGETINFIGNEKNSDILIIRTDDKGEVLWSKIYGGKNTDYAYTLEETTDGGFIVGGETNSYGAGEWDFYLLKLKGDGSVDWSKTFGEKLTDYGRAAIQSQDGGYIIAGNTFNFNTKDLDIFIAKLNSKGEVEWSRTYGGEATDYILNMALVKNGFVATGYTNSFNLSAEDAFIIHFNNAGIALWAKAFGSKFNDYGVAIAPTSNDGLIITGSTRSFGTVGEDIFIVKTLLNKNSKECNTTTLYPLVTAKINLKIGMGHYDYDLHCNTTDITVNVSNTVTAEQIVCHEEEDD